MTDNEVLARWQGWKPRKGKTRLWLNPANQVKSHVQLPNYLNDDAAAMSLLDTLVDKGFDPVLCYYRGSCSWHVQIFDGECNLIYPEKPALREAIIAACLEVARKELEG